MTGISKRNSQRRFLFSLKFQLKLIKRKQFRMKQINKPYILPFGTELFEEPPQKIIIIRTDRHIGGKMGISHY